MGQKRPGPQRSRQRSSSTPKLHPLMWLRKYGQRVCCPEGTNDGSQAIHCLERDQSRIRPVGHGLIPTLGGLIVLMVARLSDPIIPYPTGRFPFFAPIPGNKLPGYFRNVPTGQRLLTPVHEFEATSLRSPEFDDEDSGSTELAEVLSDVAFCARWLAVLSASEVGRTKRPVSPRFSP
jgi:hypothetical protein